MNLVNLTQFLNFDWVIDVVKKLLKCNTSALHMISSFQSPKAQMENSFQFLLCMFWVVVGALHPAHIKVDQI